jgi:hypothetical protein
LEVLIFVPGLLLLLLCVWRTAGRCGWSRCLQPMSWDIAPLDVRAAHLQEEEGVVVLVLCARCVQPMSWDIIPLDVRAEHLQGEEGVVGFVLCARYVQLLSWGIIPLDVRAAHLQEEEGVVVLVLCARCVQPMSWDIIPLDVRAEHVQEEEGVFGCALHRFCMEFSVDGFLAVYFLGLPVLFFLEKVVLRCFDEIDAGGDGACCTGGAGLLVRIAVGSCMGCFVKVIGSFG